MSIQRDWTYSFVTKGGISVKTHIPPYVWMYEQGNIREICIQDERGCELRINTKLNMKDATTEELETLVNNAPLPESVCKICTHKMLARGGYYRTTDECEVCCKERITAEFKVEQEKEIAREKAEDAKMKAKGYLFKTVIWIHPNSGDDYMVVQYSASKPTDASILAIIKQKRSTVKNDYSTVAL